MRSGNGVKKPVGADNNFPAKAVFSGLASAALIAAYFILPQEGTVHISYPDTGGIWTICRGHTHGVVKGQKATDQQCDAFYAEDIAIAEAAFNRLVTRPVPVNARAASIDFIFNAGAGNFSKSSMRREFNKGAIAKACAAFTLWDHAGRKDCHIRENGCYGVITRREKEKALCNDQHDYMGNPVDVFDFSGGLRLAQR